MRLRATVPATAANLGPGFDCFGLALDLCNEVTIDTDAEPAVAWDGEGAGELPVDGSDLVARAMALAARASGGSLPPMARRGLNRIPLERGLGSSAAACVAGIVLADRLLGLRLSPDEALDLAVEIEGHPDNAAAAIAGGLTIAFGDGTLHLTPSADLRPAILIPLDVRLATSEARDALPNEVPFADAVFNASHAAAAVVALTSEPRLLTQVLRDKLHQEARLRLVPEVDRLFQEVRSSGVPVCVSGAGPALLAFESAGAEVPDPGPGWRVLRPGVRSTGADVVEL